ncbi:MAG: LysM peptidoglycan-binding domain-containing protein [Alphaproteobacteria bacterium]|nr:LysM peptidoglycan-binding domain-containing protein [Alphaproteobacteria bacterium]
MLIASIWNAHSRLVTGSVGILVIVLGLVAIVSRIEPPMPSGSDQFGNTLPAQKVMPSFDIVRINQNGSAIFSGTATPGATVTLHLDHERFARVQADIHGDWVYTLGASLKPGQHIMRITTSLKGFTDSATDEQLLIDIEGVDPDADMALPNDQAIVFAASSARGLRVLQRHGLAQDLRLSALYTAQIVREPTSMVAVNGAATATVEPATPSATVVEMPVEIISAKPVTKLKIGKILLAQNQREITAEGTATANVTVRATVEGNAPREVTTDAAGKWRITAPAEDIHNTTKQLALVQIRDGIELGRRVVSLQSPSAPKAEQSSASTPSVRTVKVRKGDSLWTLAKRVYGNGSKFPKILDANKDQIKSHKDLKPSMVLKVPE